MGGGALKHEPFKPQASQLPSQVPCPLGCGIHGSYFTLTGWLMMIWPCMSIVKVNSGNTCWSVNINKGTVSWSLIKIVLKYSPKMSSARSKRRKLLEATRLQQFLCESGSSCSDFDPDDLDECDTEVEFSFHFQKGIESKLWVKMQVSENFFEIEQAVDATDDIDDAPGQVLTFFSLSNNCFVYDDSIFFSWQPQFLHLVWLRVQQ